MRTEIGAPPSRRARTRSGTPIDGADGAGLARIAAIYQNR